MTDKDLESLLEKVKASLENIDTEGGGKTVSAEIQAEVERTDQRITALREKAEKRLKDGRQHAVELERNALEEALFSGSLSPDDKVRVKRALRSLIIDNYTRGDTGTLRPKEG